MGTAHPHPTASPVGVREIQFNAGVTDNETAKKTFSCVQCSLCRKTGLRSIILTATQTTVKLFITLTRLRGSLSGGDSGCVGFACTLAEHHRVSSIHSSSSRYDRYNHCTHVPQLVHTLLPASHLHAVPS